MIKTILIDLGGVYFEEGTGKATKEIYKLIHKPNQVIDEVFKSEPRKEGFLYRKGKMTKQEFWNKAKEKLGVDDVSKLRELWFSSYTYIEGMKEIILKLREKYKIVVCSGNIKERVDYLDDKYDFKKNFDEFFLSYEVGFHKWEPEFYKILAQRYNPKESIYIDDGHSLIDIAKNQGFNTILFKNPQQLIQALRDFNVKI